MSQHDHSDHKEPHSHGCGSGWAPASDALKIPAIAVKAGATVYRIPTMDCASEEGEIRYALKDLPGLRSLSFQLSARTIAIDAPAESLPQALASIRKAGFKPVPIDQASQNDDGDSHAHHSHDHDHGLGAERPWLPEGLPRYAMAIAFAAGAEVLSFMAPQTMVFNGLGMVLAAVAIALAGFSTYVKGLAALRNLRLNINALMTVAVTGAFLIGQWPEAAMVMALYAIAELIEARSVDRARNAIKGLLDMTPETAELRQADGSWLEQAAKSAAIGAVMRIKPGARVPLDGVIVSGETSVDQAPVTGESIPVDKAAGDPVFAGTINQTGTVEARVTSASGDSLLSRIIHAVEQAQGSRAPTQQFVDKFASIYTPAVFALALAVAVLMPSLMGWTWTQGLYRALVLLVIACPCALVISTPVTVVSALAAAARRGILIKGGVHLENARHIKAIALDKTGTITQGKPKLVTHEVMATDIPTDQVLHWAADMAAHSDHPVSQAIAAGLADKRCDGDVSDFKALPGRGVEARAHGIELVLGNHRLIEERGLCSAAIEARLALHEAKGRTITMLASSSEVLALFAVSDTIKATSKEAIAQLHSLGVASVMLTGDNVATAKAIAKEAGIDDARGNLLPEDKLSAMAALQQRYGFVAMTGDGVNDAPALAKSNLGFAMGGAGTDIAMEAADIVIMNDDLRRIPEAILLSKETQSVLWQNIALALGIKAVFLGMAIFGNATMWMAVFADMGASLIVVANGLRLLKSNHD
jgi:Cd2+/Zn2+-exporting ATPase